MYKLDYELHQDNKIKKLEAAGILVACGVLAVSLLVGAILS